MMTMTIPKSQLSSISSQLEELTKGLGAIADQMSQVGEDALAAELFEVERSLNSGSRRLARIVSRQVG